MKLIYFLLELFETFYFISSDFPCNSLIDCNKVDLLVCGVCVEVASGGRQCIFPFPLVYKPFCELVTDCEDDCSGAGTCQLPNWYARYAAPSCQCKDGFYGRKCQHSNAHSRQIVFQKFELQFVNYILPAVRNLLPIYLYCGNGVGKIDGFLDIICDDDGYFERTILRAIDCHTGERIYKLFNIKFKYKPLSKNTLTLGNNVLGYLGSYKVIVQVGNTINYQQSFSLLVDYQRAKSLKCVPVVNISGCSTSKTKETVFTRSSPVEVVSFVRYITDGKFTSTSGVDFECKGSENYKWKVWNNTDDEISSDTFTKKYNVKKLNFKSFELPVGKYRIMLEVNKVTESVARNFAYCYFNVKFEPFIAVIEGGSERIVLKKFGLILKTTRSRDPNQPSYNQNHLKTSWSCIEKSNDRLQICNPLKPFSIKDRYIVTSNLLKYGTRYEIKLRVWTDSETCFMKYNREHCEAVAFANVIVANEDEGGDNEISIHCLINCENKVINNDRLCLKVKSRNKIDIKNYVWTYFEENNEGEKEAGPIKEEGFPNFLFVTKNNIFERGKNYTVVVRTVDNRLLAKYSFETLEVKFEGNCSMKPMSGVKGITTFDIICQNFYSTENSFFFEFYDKTSTEIEDGFIYNGRMLGSSEIGELRKSRVTRGQVVVYIKDVSGIYTHVQFNVSLLQSSVKEKDIDEIFLNISNSMDKNNFDEVFQYLSVLPDIIPIKLFTSKIFERILLYITDLPKDTLSRVKLALSVLFNVFLKLNESTQFPLEPDLMETVLSFIHTTTQLVHESVATGSSALQGATSEEVFDIARSLLTCLHFTLKCKDLNYSEVDDIQLNFEIEDSLQHSAMCLEKVVNLLQDILTYLQRPGLPPIQVTATKVNSTVLMAVINDGDYNLTNYLTHGNNVRVTTEFLEEFREPVGNTYYHLALRVANFDDNLFWWRRSDVKSNLVSVSLVQHFPNKNMKRISLVKNPLDVQINLNPHLLNSTYIISDITFSYNFNVDCSVNSDLNIKIHRLDPAPLSLIRLRFLYPQTNGSLYVWITSKYRPNCENIKEKATKITAETPLYDPVVVQQPEQTFYYIGIIPAVNTTNGTVRYTFEVNTTVCQHWMDGYWSSEGCKICKDKTTGLSVHCYCGHFSIFAAAFPVPPQEVDPFSDINLFLTIFENPFVILFVTAVLLVYLVTCFLAWRMDKTDKNLKNVILLGDNFPEDRYPYLLAVYTSSRFNAGTTAHVGLKIIGSSGTSRAHILASPERKVLKRSHDDWFLLYCAECLGKLERIHIWHDNAGSSPDWFCSRIVVYDLKDSSNTVFIVEEWLALRLNNYSEAMISAASVSQVKNFKRMMMYNCVQGLRDSHVLLSIIFRHPRSAISRLQKVNILACFTMVAMLCSIMWFEPQVDENEYNVGSRDFLISITSMVVSVAIMFVVVFAFKHSYKYKKHKTRSTTLYKLKEFKEYHALENIHEKKTFFSQYVRFVSKRLKGNPLLPVQLNNSESIVQKKKVFFITAWVSCITLIIICSFFVMLYGLKLGPKKSKMWLSCVVFTLSEEVFIVGPAKVFLLAVMLSIAFQNLIETETQVYVNDEDVKIEISEELQTYYDVGAKRNLSMYAPLRSIEIGEMMRRTALRKNWWNVIDFSVSLCFIIVLNIVVFYLWSSYYFTNSHVKNIIELYPKMGSEHVLQINSITDINYYLHESLTRLLYNSYWYNNQPIIEDSARRGYWTNDFTHRSIGFQRLRQVRVESASCKFVKYLNTSRRCIPKWDKEHEDTEDYGVGWSMAQWHDEQVDNSPWRYTSSHRVAASLTNRLRGRSGTVYHDGGYLVDLGPDRMMAEMSVHDLIDHRWQDQLTSAFFLEFTLYNVNWNTLSKVTVIVEYLTTGNIQLRNRVISVDSRIPLGVWGVLPIAFVFYYVVRCGYLINQQGLMEFLASPLNSTQVLVVLLSISCLILAGVHYITSIAKYEEFVTSGHNSYFDFDSFFQNLLWLHRGLFILILISFFLLVLFFVGGRTLMNYFYTLKISSFTILWLSIVIILLLLFQVPLMLSLNLYSFSSIQDAVTNTKYFCDGPHSTSIYADIFFVLKILVLRLIMMLFVLGFIFYFKVAQTYKLSHKSELNVLTFILSQVKRAIYKQR